MAGCSHLIGQNSTSLAACQAAAAQSAISINNGSNQIMSMLTSVLGGLGSDRYGKRAILTVGFSLIIGVNFIFAFTTSFTVVYLANLWGGLVGGVQSVLQLNLWC